MESGKSSGKCHTKPKAEPAGAVHMAVQLSRLPLWLDSVDLKISFAACPFLPSLLLPYFCRTSWRWAVFFVLGSRFLPLRPQLTKIIGAQQQRFFDIFIYIKNAKEKYIFFS